MLTKHANTALLFFDSACANGPHLAAHEAVARHYGVPLAGLLQPFHHSSLVHTRGATCELLWPFTRTMGVIVPVHHPHPPWTVHQLIADVLAHSWPRLVRWVDAHTSLCAGDGTLVGGDSKTSDATGEAAAAAAAAATLPPPLASEEARSRFAVCETPLARYDARELSAPRSDHHSGGSSSGGSGGSGGSNNNRYNKLCVSYRSQS